MTPHFAVMSRRCDECLMDPDNRIVDSKRAAEILAETKREDIKFICHKASIGGKDIACRGHHDAVGPCLAARFAMATGIPIVEYDPETLEPIQCP